MKNTQSGFVMPLLLALIVAMLIGGGVYVYVQNKQGSQPEAASKATGSISTNTKSTNTNSAIESAPPEIALLYVHVNKNHPNSNESYQLITSNIVDGSKKIIGDISTSTDIYNSGGVKIISSSKTILVYDRNTVKLFTVNGQTQTIYTAPSGSSIGNLDVSPKGDMAVFMLNTHGQSRYKLNSAKIITIDLSPPFTSKIIKSVPVEAFTNDIDYSFYINSFDEEGNIGIGISAPVGCGASPYYKIYDKSGNELQNSFYSDTDFSRNSTNIFSPDGHFVASLQSIAGNVMLSGSMCENDLSHNVVKIYDISNGSAVTIELDNSSHFVSGVQTPGSDYGWTSDGQWFVYRKLSISKNPTPGQYYEPTLSEPTFSAYNVATKEKNVFQNESALTQWLYSNYPDSTMGRGICIDAMTSIYSNAKYNNLTRECAGTLMIEEPGFNAIKIIGLIAL